MVRSCLWVWTGAGWGEPLGFPHDCPEGQTCDEPSSEGTYAGQMVSTVCHD